MVPVRSSDSKDGWLGAAATLLDWVRRQAGKPALRSGGGGGGWVCGRRAPLS